MYHSRATLLERSRLFESYQFSDVYTFDLHVCACVLTLACT
jgi:hypothetical protein